MTAWEPNNCNNMLPNIPRSKGNQTMKIGQLIECNMRHIFSWKIIHKMRFWKVKIEHKVLSSLFALYVELRAIEIFWNWALDHLLLRHIKIFFSFRPLFSKKNVSLAIFYELMKFHCLVALTLWDIGQYVLWLIVNKVVTT